MKKLVTGILAVIVFATLSIFSALPASAMPCDGPGCDGNSYTGYPGGKNPAPIPGVFRSPLLHAPVQVTATTSKPVVNINCYTGIKTQTTVTSLYAVSKDDKGKTTKRLIDFKPTYLKRPVTKKECPVKLKYNLAGH